MKYFVFRVRWSQTDDDTVIVQADSHDAALSILKAGWSARYFEYLGETSRIVS